MRAAVAASRVLALAASSVGCSAALVQDGTILRSQAVTDARGAPRLLPGLVAELLADSAGFGGVAVTVGPGSFTGLRAAISIAHGLALGAGVKLVGVTTAEALGWGWNGARPCWVAIDTRRGHVFLVRGATVESVALTDLPMPDGPVALAGDAAAAVACRLAARGADVMLTALRHPEGGAVGLVGERRLAGLLPPLDAQPLYGDPPEARRQAGRPAPV